MSSLINTKIEDTYTGLLKTSDNSPIDATLKTIQDGNGGNLPIQVSTTGVNFTGTVTGLPASTPGGLVAGTGTDSIASNLTATPAVASNADTIAIGKGTTASNFFANAYGASATASGSFSQAFGTYCEASNGYAVAVGTGCTASGNISVAVGKQCTASGANSISYGIEASATPQNSIAIGNLASVPASQDGGIAIGGNCNVKFDGITIGNNINNYSPQNGIAIGKSSSTGSASHSIAIGANTSSTAQGSVALGYNLTASTADTVTIKKLQMLDYATLNFADDTAAATGGIPLGGVYHTSGALKIRIA